jgi:hypothetical protein
MAQNKETMPTTQRTKTIWRVVGGAASVVFSVLLIVVTRGRVGKA